MFRVIAAGLLFAAPHRPLPRLLRLIAHEHSTGTSAKSGVEIRLYVPTLGTGKARKGEA